MAPHEGVLFVLFSEVEFGNQAIVGGRIEDSRCLLAELQAGHFLVEALCEFASLLHLAQVPENHSFGCSPREDVLAEVESAELAAGTYLRRGVRLNVWMGLLVPKRR